MEARDERGEIEPTFIAGGHSLTHYVDKRESIYKQARAVHGCALCKGAENLMLGEDFGRRNAVGAIAGQIWLDRIDGGDKVFYTTGRLTSQIVIKCAQMGIPIQVASAAGSICRPLGLSRAPSGNARGQFQSRLQPA